MFSYVFLYGIVCLSYCMPYVFIYYEPVYPYVSTSVSFFYLSYPLSYYHPVSLYASLLYSSICLYYILLYVIYYILWLDYIIITYVFYYYDYVIPAHFPSIISHSFLKAFLKLLLDP